MTPSAMRRPRHSGGSAHLAAAWRRALAPCAAVLCLASGPLIAEEIISVEPRPPVSFFLRFWPFGSQPAAPSAAAADAAPPAASVPASPVAASRSTATPEKPSPGSAWASLSPAQRAALEPLAREWGSLDDNRRQKWIEIADRMPRMSPEMQARMRERMAEWAHMTPQQRAHARLRFQEARQVAPVNRKESWEAYQALSEEKRRSLAERAAKAAPAAAPRPSPAGAAARATGTAGMAKRDEAEAKSNIVVAPDVAVAPRPVAPTVVQAQPGATTTLMSRRPAPPGHQQAGLPKIAAMPGFVDSATLLPQRGAQGAAVHSVAASDARPRR